MQKLVTVSVIGVAFTRGMRYKVGGHLSLSHFLLGGNQGSWWPCSHKAYLLHRLKDRKAVTELREHFGV